MSVDVSVHVTGAHELARAMRAADPATRLEMRLANQLAAEYVVDDALPHVPRGRTGNLRRSLEARGTQTTGKAIAGSSTVVYGAAIHWGRKVGNVGSPPGNHMGPNRIAGRPFLHDAAKRMNPKITETYGAAVAELLNRVIGRA